ncbi:MAG: hypothetical protein HC809_03010 [Gammaproteobacteria bacterium]|nr:hypothetical protein [Gammaproteobacteria bacterium]
MDQRENGPAARRLLSVDPVLSSFASRNQLAITRNYHNSPERSLRWGKPVERLIQIYLEDEQHLTWNVWLCAFEDRPTGRFWKTEFMHRSIPMADLQPALPGVLDRGFAIVQSWTADDLEPAQRQS